MHLLPLLCINISFENFYLKFLFVFSMFMTMPSLLFLNFTIHIFNPMSFFVTEQGKDLETYTFLPGRKEEDVR